MKNVTDTGKIRRKKNKLFVIEKFGGKCCHCGESDPRTLTLDHTNNNGNVECAGKKKRIRSSDFYAKLIAENIERRDLQLLCFNCHAKKDLFYNWE
jgi:hypothetical protein